MARGSKRGSLWRWPAVSAVKYAIPRAASRPCKSVPLKGFYMCLGFGAGSKGTRHRGIHHPRNGFLCSPESPRPGLQGQTQLSPMQAGMGIAAQGFMPGRPYRARPQSRKHPPHPQNTGVSPGARGSGEMESPQGTWCVWGSCRSVQLLRYVFWQVLPARWRRPTMESHLGRGMDEAVVRTPNRSS